MNVIKSFLNDNTNVRRPKMEVRRIGGTHIDYKSTFWFLSHLKRKRGQYLARWEDDRNLLLSKNNFQRVTSDRSEWDRLQEIFAHFGPRIDM